MKRLIIIKLTSLFLALFVLVGMMFLLLYSDDPNHIYHIFPFVSSYNTANGNSELNETPPSYYNYEHYSYYNANPDEPYNIGNAAIDSKNVKEIYIDWTYGNIEIVETDDTAISIKEKCLSNFDYNKLRYRIVDNTLEIRYMNSGTLLANNGDGKNLTLSLPESDKGKFDIRTNSVKTDISVRDVTLSDLTATVVYGDLTINKGKIYNLYYYAKNGNVYTNCSLSALAVTLDQGIVDCSLDNSAKDVNIKADNGSVTLYLPENVHGYLAKIYMLKMNEGTVGFNTDFTDERESGENIEIFRYGDESLSINTEIANGDFKIKKK